MASLFGKNKLRDIASKLSTPNLEDKIAIIKTWQQDYHNGSLKKDKETSREQAYNQDFFIKILGYKEKPVTPYSFEPKATTEKRQLPDAVIGHTDVSKQIANITAVIELKSGSVALDRPQRREGNMSPVQQGFKYKTQYRNCPFVIVSNFWEFRLYHDTQLDYEVWTLDNLVDPKDDYLKFKIFYTLLHSDNFITAKGPSKTENLLSDIRLEQEEIGKKFYKVYREARLELLRDVYQKNEKVRANIDIGIEKAQKIIDRIIFACFAEDKGLLPDNTLQRVIKAADSSTFGGSLWNTLKGFFEAIDIGNEKLEIPDGYNGGLFQHDEILNNLQISDKALHAVIALSNYNFMEDLSITILGHIFEQSISDLEEIKSKVNESQNLDVLQQSRRKKDGIFYTPDYIVRYIVENSLGAYLREHEEKFKQEFGLKGDINDTNYEKREKQTYLKYQDFLHNIKIVDPACGSGAFLVYVFDYLLAENKRVASILGNLFSSDNYVKSILQNNIYGVDLNEESVEITKLSLWLKTAQKNKKLTVLDQNIKRGNSLIDDPAVAEDKAFNWQKEFPKIFKDGGFDIVVGNPPYVNIELMPAKDKDYYKSKYKTFYKRSDLFSLFLEAATDKTKSGGYVSFIMPSIVLNNLSYQKIRDYLLENNWLNTVCYTGGKVFSDATVDTVILIVKKSQNKRIMLQNAVDFNDIKQHSVVSDYFKIYNNAISVSEQDASDIGDKIFNPTFETVDTHFNVFQGIVTGNNDAFIFENEAEALAKGIERELLKPLCHGRDIGKWQVRNTERRILYLDSNADIKKYPKAEEWLTQFKEAIMHTKDNNTAWYSLHRPRDKKDLDIVPKIAIQNTRNESLKTRLVATLDTQGFYSTQGVNFIIPRTREYSIEFLLSILNSKLINYLFTTKFLNLAIKADYLKQLRLPKITFSGQKPFIERVQQMLEMTRELSVSSDRFQQLVAGEFGFEKWSTKLKRWWTLNFSSFVTALKLKLSLQQKDELLSLFEKYRSECLELDNKIKKTEQEIDQLVYKLYSLTPEEISLVENTTL